MAHQLEHFPSSPHRPPKHVLYFSSSRGMSVHGFCTPSSAAAMFHMVVGDTPYKWKDRESVYCEDLDLTIKCHTLEDVVEATPLDTLPTPYPRMAANIRNEIHHEPVAPTPAPTRRAPSTPKSRDDDLVSISMLCEELKLKPSKARAILRDKGVPKPEHGWAWTPEEADRIRKVLR